MSYHALALLALLHKWNSPRMECRPDPLLIPDPITNDAQLLPLALPLTATSMSLLPHDPASDLHHQAEAIDICRPEHCFHAFDALYCALTFAEPIPPQFEDDK